MIPFVLIRDIFLLLLYAVTSLAALIGNGLVCCISLRREHHHHHHHQQSSSLTLSTTTIFLVNLAIADALAGLTIPLQFLFCSSFLLDKFPSSISYLCVISKSLQILAYNTSTLTMCIIAIDRYRLVQKPLEQQYRVNARRALPLAWFLSALFALTCLVSMKVHTYFISNHKLISCQILFPITHKYIHSDYIRTIRVLCLVLLFYIVPLLLTGILYFLTMQTIAHRAIIGVQRFRTFEQSRTRTIRMLMIVVIVFALSHLPVHFMHMRDFFFSSPKFSPVRLAKPNKCNDSTIYLFFYWLGISSCCHNPIIYSWFNARFRAIVLNCCRSIVCGCGRRREHRDQQQQQQQQQRSIDCVIRL